MFDQTNEIRLLMQALQRSDLELEPDRWDAVDRCLQRLLQGLADRDNELIDDQLTELADLTRRFTQGVSAQLGAGSRRPAAQGTQALVNRVVDQLIPAQGGPTDAATDDTGQSPAAR